MSNLGAFTEEKCRSISMHNVLQFSNCFKLNENDQALTLLVLIMLPTSNTFDNHDEYRYKTNFVKCLR